MVVQCSAVGNPIGLRQAGEEWLFRNANESDRPSHSGREVTVFQVVRSRGSGSLLSQEAAVESYVVGGESGMDMRAWVRECRRSMCVVVKCGGPA